MSKTPKLFGPLTPETVTNRPASERVLAEARKTAIQSDPQPYWDTHDLLIKGGLIMLGIVLAIVFMCLGGGR